MFTHEPEQFVAPPSQSPSPSQVPVRQTSSSSHAVAHAPQLPALDKRSTHAPPQFV
jgi:hypothetical protein